MWELSLINNQIFILLFIIEMKVVDIISDARAETNTSQTQINDEKALKKLNKAYQRVWRAIVNAQEDYFWNYWTTEIQEWVTEYTIQRKEVEIWSKTAPWIAKFREVQIKVGEGYEPLRELSDYELKNGARGYILADNHIILSFTPKENREDWLRIVGIQAINNLNLEDEDSAIFPWHEDLLDFISVIQKGLEYELWKEKQDFEKANFAMQEMQAELAEMIRFISHRTQKIYYSNLQY